MVVPFIPVHPRNQHEQAFSERCLKFVLGHPLPPLFYKGSCVCLHFFHLTESQETTRYQTCLPTNNNSGSIFSIHYQPPPRNNKISTIFPHRIYIPYLHTVFIYRLYRLPTTAHSDKLSIYPFHLPFPVNGNTRIDLPLPIHN